MKESHSFSVDVASKIGLIEAIILQHICFLQKNFHSGKENWRTMPVKRSIAKMRVIYPYLTDKQIRGALDRLESDGLTLSSIQNSDVFDREKSYVLTDEAFDLLGENEPEEQGQNDLTKGQMPFDKRANVHLTKGQMLIDNNKDSNLVINKKERAKRAAPEKEKPFYQLPINERLYLIEEHAAQKQNNAVIQFIWQSWFIEVWQEYLKHRKDYKAKPYKFPITEYTAICELLTFSKGEHNTAKQVISQSVSKGWIGLFALKGNNAGNANSDNQQPKYAPVKAKRFGVNL